MKKQLLLFAFIILLFSVAYGQVSTISIRNMLSSLSDYLTALAFLLSAASIYLVTKKFNFYNEIVPKILNSSQLDKLIESKININNNSNKYNYSDWKIKDLINRINDLESQINRLNKDIESQITGSIINSTTSSYSGKDNPSKLPEILYLSTPNSDGSFNETSASSSYRDGASIYKLIKIENDKAQFQIDEKETSVKLALQYPDRNIDPVCDAENAFNSRANKISTIKMGETELQNGRWIINSKAVIRYED